MRIYTEYLMFCLMAVVAAGCAHSAEYVQDDCVSQEAVKAFVRMARNPNATVADVKVFKGKPDRPFLRIGMLQATWTDEDTPLRKGDLIKRIREEAARLGAGGIVNIRSRSLTVTGTTRTEKAGNTGMPLQARRIEVRADAVLFVDKKLAATFQRSSCDPIEVEW